MIDGVASGGEHTIAELFGDRGVERPLFERFASERADAGENAGVVRKNQFELHPKV